MKYTVPQFLSYVQGWLDSEAANNDQLTMGNMMAALSNAILTIDDPCDGIQNFVERQGLQNYRFEGKYVREFNNDQEAFEYSLGFYDDRCASVEKWMDGEWAEAANPIYQPQYFKGRSEGGWIKSNGKLIEYDS